MIFAHRMLAPQGSGVAPTPWRAVQRAWEALNKTP
jgi:hypothetical protein